MAIPETRRIENGAETETGLEELEIRLLLEGVFRQCGFDFRDYAMASLRRRIRQFAGSEAARTISGVQEKVLHDAACRDRFLLALSLDVTAMFRDPGFYLAFRTKAVPLLRDHRFPRIWHAGCATGEEVYSMAILLREEGLYDRCRIYATDMNGVALAKASEGILPLALMQEYSSSYLQAGGKGSLSDYHTARYHSAILDPRLLRNVTFAQHNLVTDSSFNDFHAILCRNVMIYFNRPLQRRVQQLIYDSLAMSGVLGLGSKESIQFGPHAADFAPLDARERLYQKVK